MHAPELEAPAEPVGKDQYPGFMDHNIKGNINRNLEEK
jgi:hypothetical protein